MTTTPPVVAVPVASPRWYERPWLLKLASMLLGALLGATCPLWPEPVRPLCASVAGAVRGADFGAGAPVAPPPELPSVEIPMPASGPAGGSGF